MPWPDPPLHPTEPEEPESDEPFPWTGEQSTLGALGLGHVAQLNSQRSNKRKNTLGFAPEGGRPKSRRRRK